MVHLTGLKLSILSRCTEELAISQSHETPNGHFLTVCAHVTSRDLKTLVISKDIIFYTIFVGACSVRGVGCSFYGIGPTQRLNFQHFSLNTSGFP